MKVIIAGGRKTRLTMRDKDRLDDILITEVVSGGQGGVDKDGATYGRRIGIPVKVFKVNLRKHGGGAESIRNREMTNYADAAVFFPGGSGTDSILHAASRAGIVVYDFR